jgi:hypothetical protein
VIANNTKYELDLDLDESCGRECDHKGDFTTLLYNNNAQIMSLVAHQIGGVEFQISNSEFRIFVVVFSGRHTRKNSSK